MRENNGRSGYSLLGSMLWRTPICFFFFFVLGMENGKKVVVCAVRTVSCVCGACLDVCLLLLMHHLFLCVRVCGVIAMLIKAKRGASARGRHFTSLNMAQVAAVKRKRKKNK